MQAEMAVAVHLKAASAKAATTALQEPYLVHAMTSILPVLLCAARPFWDSASTGTSLLQGLFSVSLTDGSGAMGLAAAVRLQAATALARHASRAEDSKCCVADPAFSPAPCESPLATVALVSKAILGLWKAGWAARVVSNVSFAAGRSSAPADQPALALAEPPISGSW